MTNRRLIAYTLAALLSGGTGLFYCAAADKASPKQRQEEVKKLTPEEREAREKQRLELMEKHLAALRSRQQDGTLGEKGQKQLEELEKQLEQLEKAQQHPTKGSLKPARTYTSDKKRASKKKPF